MSLSDETLFVGAAGRVRGMDVASGGHAGEWLAASGFPAGSLVLTWLDSGPAAESAQMARN